MADKELEIAAILLDGLIAQLDDAQQQAVELAIAEVEAIIENFEPIEQLLAIAKINAKLGGA